MLFFVFLFLFLTDQLSLQGMNEWSRDQAEAKEIAPELTVLIAVEQEEVKVIDEITASTKAIGLLQETDRRALQKESYMRNRFKALRALYNFGNKTFDQLVAHGLQGDASRDSYVDNFVSKKIADLDRLYGCGSRQN